MLAESYKLQNGSLDGLLRDLPGYWKLWSAALLLKAGLRGPVGFIVTRPHKGLMATVASFVDALGISEVLLRHDAKEESPPYPRGGFLVRLTELENALNWFFDHERIVAIYEPLDPTHNGHNINLLFVSATEAVAEVVGPGFDASDLQRGDLSPHERFGIHLDGGRSVLDTRVAWRTTDTEYRQSIESRSEKLRQKAAQVAATFGVRSPACEFRKGIPTAYQPFDIRKLQNIVSAVTDSSVVQLFHAATGVGYPLNFSTSFVEGGHRQVYWDITSPSLKYRGLKKLRTPRGPSDSS